MKTWSPLVSNDTIEIVAPASPCSLENLDQGINWIKHQKLIPRVPDNIIQKDLFFASNLKTQLEQLKAAVYSDSKVLWCLRGGYGSMRLIPHMLKWKKPEKTKLLIGFSDITSLHLFFNQHWKWPSLHARTVSQMNLENAHSSDRRLLKQILFGIKTQKTFKNLKPLNNPAKEAKTIQAPLCGGNLRILQSSLGTSWQLNARGKILFIEDISERGYSIDRMLEQMIQAKILESGLKAVVFGDFTLGDEKNGENFIDVTLKRFAERVPYPVLKGLPVGHKENLNYPLPFQTKCELVTGTRPHLTCQYF